MHSDEPYYQELISHYENCFEQYGPVPKGVDWPNAEDLATRFSVMLDVCKTPDHKHIITLLDLGCGYGALLDHMKALNLHSNYAYRGIDLASRMIEVASQRHGSDYFEVRNILTDRLPGESFDYIVMNGVFTEKRSLSDEQMEKFITEMLKAAFDASRMGIAFNVMNYHVDWFRDELFYMPFDRMISIIKQHLARHVIIRADYGLYEYTVYVYKKPNNNEYRTNNSK